jgi:hypothetical protein
MQAGLQNARKSDLFAGISVSRFDAGQTPPGHKLLLFFRFLPSENNPLN